MEQLIRFATLGVFAFAMMFAASRAQAQPNVSILDLQPSFWGQAQAFPLAAQTSLDDPSYEISLDVTLRNNESVPLTLSQVTLSFGPGYSPPSAALSTNLQMQCGAGAVTPVSVSAVLPPGQSCRVMLTNDPRIQPGVPEWIDMLIFFQDWSPLALTFPIVNYSNFQPRGGFLFPASASDLAPDEFWSTRSTGTANRHRQSPSQMFAYDAGVLRFDADAGIWTDKHPLSNGETSNTDENEDWLVWGKPIYAMADGVVASCTDGIPDNLPGVIGGNSNNFVIDHGAERASYLHLMNGSVNAALCVNGAIIEEGDFLGLAGNSGFSTAPHLHIQIQRGGQGFPLLFRDAFIVERETYLDPPNGNADWELVDGRGLPWENLAVWPSPLRRRATLTAGPARYPALLDRSADMKVAAFRNGAGNLELCAYTKGGDGDLLETNSDLAGGIVQVAMAKSSITTDFVTAVRTSLGQLKLIVWNGFLSRAGDAVGSTVKDVAVATSPHVPGVVTAVRNAGGSLEVIGWSIDGLGNIQEGGKDPGGPVTAISIATAPAFGGVVTAVRNAAGNLEVSSWVVSKNETVVDYRDHLTHNAILDVEIAYLGEVGGQDRMMTAARDAAGNLLLSTWDIAANGDITHLDDASAGTVTKIAIADGGDSHALTAVRDGGGKLKLIGWKVDASGQIERHGESPAGAISEVALGQAMFVSPTNRRQAVTAVRDSAGDLRVISWEVALEP